MKLSAVIKKYFFIVKANHMDKRVFDVPINWALMAAFAAFWTYGYFGAVSFKNINFVGNILISVILYGIFLIFLLLSHYQKNQFRDILTIRGKDVVAFLSFLIVMLALSLGELTSSLAGDQFIHAQTSQKHIITLLLKLPEMTGLLNNFIFSHVLFLLNLLSIILIIFLYYILKNRNFITKVVLLSLSFFIFRIAIIMTGSSGTSHPPLRLFPLWLSSSLLSSTDFSFRLPQFLSLIAFMWLAQRIVSRKLTFSCSWFFGLTVGTIPLLWYVGTLVEQSVWTAIIWSIFLLVIARNDEFNDFKWVRWFSIISIFTLLRQTVFLALIPLFTFYIVYGFGKSEHKFKQLFFVLAPVLVMLPFLIRSFVLGTPATYVPGETDWIPKDASSIDRVWLAMKSGIAPWIVLNSVLLPWAIFPILAFIIYPRNIKKAVNTFVIFAFFVMAFSIFYTIKICLWGEDRYQAEYIIPFAILGFYYIVTKLYSTGVSAKFLSIGLICLIIYNIFIFRGFNYIYAKQNYCGFTLKSEPSYNYRDALRAIKDGSYAGHTYIAGITYGVLPEILNGFTIAEVYSTNKLLSDYDNTREYKKINNAAESINLLPEIKAVLVSDIGQKDGDEIIKGLHILGWRSWQNFSDNRSGTNIYGMIRGVK